MSSIISSNQALSHSVSKYNFKIISFDSKEEQYDEIQPVDNEVEQDRPSGVDSNSISQSSKDSLIESLLQKTDEMSSNFIKLQMKLEMMGEEHKVEIARIKNESYAEGLEAGVAKAAKEAETNLAGGMAQFSSSVSTLEKSAKEFQTALEEIKKELINAALDISKEVVGIELSENSTKIASHLSGELIKELQNASKITLKVNPKDHGAISQSVGLMENVKLISDSAVSEGGVIAISDAGNIDAQISKRFERIKKAALSE
ncbi:flagellar assembly protein FliH [Sulfurimonas sp.]|uniref:flagellar assembly protein FliH n=1 Tax=Sulfurimonas sp. TaxID=2022749 RepID=UPI0025FA7854|nr:flagellar assembly protein FliH [Sulfurimonas sp.]MDD5157467.1 flagellar assembly protein FliH [Sulfurimonas sp.]